MAVHGVAVAIPSPWGEELQARREDLGDPMARAIPPHITLLPPTEIPGEQLDAFRDHLATVAAAHPPFVVQLRGTGTFRPISPVVFVQVAQGIPMCERLESGVRSGPVRRDLDFPYHPHVTVAHDIAEQALDRAYEELAGFEATFEVTQIHLFDHGEDGVWRPQHAVDLTGEASG